MSSDLPDPALIKPRPAEQQLEAIVAFLQEQGGGSFGLVYDDKDKTWIVALHFGEEEPGSDMVAGASYAVSPHSPAEAVEMVLLEVGK